MVRIFNNTNVLDCFICREFVFAEIQTMLKLFALTSSAKVESTDFLQGIETYVASKTSHTVKRGKR